MTELERRCVGALQSWLSQAKVTFGDEATLAIVRAVLAEAGAVGEPEINYEIWQHNGIQASSTDETEARHYAAVYSEDGPVELVRAVTYRQKVQP